MSGNVMQDEDSKANNDYNDGLDDGHQTDMDPEVRAGTIKALRRANATFSCGTQAECSAAHLHEQEEEEEEEEEEEKEKEEGGGRRRRRRRSRKEEEEEEEEVQSWRVWGRTNGW